MKIIGLLRVKNESRWIERSIGSILPLCERVLVFDDHSTDDTVQLCASLPKVTVLPSPFQGLNEARDKNYLLEQAEPLKPEWIIAIDGDEMLAPGCEDRLRNAMNTHHSCLSPRILYLWDSEHQIRTDGVYGDFHRESMFRFQPGVRFIGDNGANFHCGNVPMACRQKRLVVDDVQLLHFGYIDRDLRLRKWDFYNQNDPTNRREGFDPKYPERRCYPHIVQGDVAAVPADLKLMHAGPLHLEELHTCV